MNILGKLRLFISSLFTGLSSADEIIIGQSSNGDDKVLPVQQVKDHKRVADKLLKGEVSQEVKELRYRDYLISETSRHYKVSDNEAQKLKIHYNPNYFGGYNHSICNGLGDDDNKEEFTLKFEYEDVPRFNLSKYCTHFQVNTKSKQIMLFFNLIPNRNIGTSKAFIKYLEQSMISSRLGGDFWFLKTMWFVSYKITALQNYLKFTFKDLLLTNIDHTDKEIILTYGFESYEMENLIEKYKVEELEEKYKNKEPKHLPHSDIEYDIILKCEKCGKPLTQNEGELNKKVCGKYYCSECLFTETMNNNLKI